MDKIIFVNDGLNMAFGVSGYYQHCHAFWWLNSITFVLCDNCQVVCKHTPWEGGYVGINSFGVGGANAHVLLRSADSDETTRTTHVAATETRLVTCAARTKDGVETTLTEMLKHPTDVDMQYLLQSSVGTLSASTHPYRGFALVNTANSQQTVQVAYCTCCAMLSVF